MTRRDEALDFCRIERWRGYVSSAFYAVAGDGVVHLSETFRWRRSGSPPDEGAARAAYDAVVAKLEADGWTRHSVGSVWHETTFSRPAPSHAHEAAVEVPAPPVAPPIVAPPPQAREHVEPAAPPPPPRRGRRARIALIAGVAAVAVAGVAGAVARDGSSPAARQRAAPHRTHAAAKPTLRHAAPAPAAPRAAEPAAKAPAAATVDVVIAADRGSSWIEIRRGSSTGKVLFAAELAPGKRLHYRAQRLWARFGAAGNLAITVDGKSLALQGTFDKVFHA